MDKFTDLPPELQKAILAEQQRVAADIESLTRGMTLLTKTYEPHVITSVMFDILGTVAAALPESRTAIRNRAMRTSQLVQKMQDQFGERTPLFEEVEAFFDKVSEEEGLAPAPKPLKTELPPLQAPTSDEREALMALTDRIGGIVAGQRADIVLGALMATHANIASNLPDFRTEVIADLRLCIQMVEAMGDAPPDVARMRAQAAMPQQVFEKADLNHGLAH